MTFQKNIIKSPLLGLLFILLSAGLLLFIYTNPLKLSLLPIGPICLVLGTIILAFSQKGKAKTITSFICAPLIALSLFSLFLIWQLYYSNNKHYTSLYQVKDIKESGPLWSIEQYEALTENDTTLAEVINTHGLADKVSSFKRQEGESLKSGFVQVSYIYGETDSQKESQVITLVFSHKDEKLISKSYRHENSSYFENDSSINTNFNWTNEDYQQLTLGSLYSDGEGANYSDIIDKHGLPAKTTLTTESGKDFYRLTAEYRNSRHSNVPKHIAILFSSKTFDGPYTAYDKQSANFD